jgi:hypothetical protein
LGDHDRKSSRCQCCCRCVPGTGGVPAAQAGGITRLCGIGFTSATPTRCVAPGKVGTVERRLALQPIRPSAVVNPETHLRLRRVALLDAPRPSGIEYLYGKIPQGVNQLPAFALPDPQYVLIVEEIGPPTRSGAHLTYDKGHPEYRTHFQCHALTLVVDSNLSGNVTRRLGKRIVGLERCPGK